LGEVFASLVSRAALEGRNHLRKGGERGRKTGREAALGAADGEMAGLRGDGASCARSGRRTCWSGESERRFLLAQRRKLRPPHCNVWGGHVYGERSGQLRQSRFGCTRALALDKEGEIERPKLLNSILGNEDDGQKNFLWQKLGKHELQIVSPGAGSKTWVEIQSKAEPIRLRIQNDGTFELWRKDGSNGEVLCCSGNLTLPETSKDLEFSWSVPVNEKPSKCHSVTIHWGKDAALVVHPPRNNSSGWNQGLNSGFVLDKYVNSSDTDRAEICIDMTTSGKWFGGGHFMKQIWPLNEASWEVGPYYPFDHGPNGLNTLIAPQWVTSTGLLVMMDPDTPFLHVGMNGPAHGPNGKRTRRKWGTGVQNASKEVLPLTTSECKFANHDGVLRLQARASFKDESVTHPLSEWNPLHDGEQEFVKDASDKSGGEKNIRISVALCAFPNILDAAMASLKTHPRPKVMPNLNVLQRPIWTTWAKYKQWVSQKKVLRYAEEILRGGLDHSVMEIDDRWQVSYGDLEFDHKKFPDPKAMVDKLHEMGFKVTLWVMPFVERRSAAFAEGHKKGYFVKSIKRRGKDHEPGFFNWWNFPPVVALDVTNPEAVEWYVSRLKRLQTLYGIDGFKFDAGEPCFLPKKFKTLNPIGYPSEYTHLWVSQVAGRFQGGVSEVRTGHRTQSVGLMTRIGDRFSTWDISNGLQSIIPTVLTSGLLGYPFALPDIIGGNAYFGRNPDTELFVRWTQVNALMPAMQFSIAPWHIGRDAEKLCMHAIELRKKLRSQMLALAEDAMSKLQPIIRPMWWLDPEDEATFDISDQYALGDDIIVAPVVVKGQRFRDVYLTHGVWEDLTQPGRFFQGGKWLLNLEAPLSKLPCFRRIEESYDLFDSDSYEM